MFTFMLISMLDFTTPDRVSALIGSNHIAAKSAYNEKNPGVFITWNDAVGPFDLSIGAYRNSYDRLSTSATFAYSIHEMSYLELSVFAGAAHYPEDGRKFQAHLHDIVPIGGLQVISGNMFMQFIPDNGVHTRGIVSFGVTVPLK